MYKSTKDKFFITTMLIILLIILAVFLVPYSLDIYYNIVISPFETIFMTALLGIMIGIILWIMMAIRYEFLDNYLFIQAGPFRSKVFYKDISKVESTYFSVMDALAGYQLMMSRDGVEIHYKTALLGSIRISPERKKEFLVELEKRAPQAKFIKR